MCSAIEWTGFFNLKIIIDKKLTEIVKIDHHAQRECVEEAIAKTNQHKYSGRKFLYLLVSFFILPGTIMEIQIVVINLSSSGYVTLPVISQIDWVNVNNWLKQSEKQTTDYLQVDLEVLAQPLTDITNCSDSYHNYSRASCLFISLYLC